MTIQICELTKGITTWKWLCDPCIAKRKADDWSVKVDKQAKYRLVCDDCEAPGLQSNAPVDYVPPDPDSRLPSRDEVARMPGVGPMKPWATKEEKRRLAR